VLRKFLDRKKVFFEREGWGKRLSPIFEMFEDFLYTTGEITRYAPHARDSLGFQRMMITVIVALLPSVLMALYNTGLQANLALAEFGITDPQGWRLELLRAIGISIDSTSTVSNFLHGALFFLPVLIVTYLVGGLWEVFFSCVKQQEVTEGFLVTGLLFPLILPATIPLWQVALGISFGVVFGKLIYGGTGMNFLNPALTARAFLFFSYPTQITGDVGWPGIDGLTGATPLAAAAVGRLDSLAVSWQNAFLGLIPGDMGETSTLACLLGAALLLMTRVASWRIMASVSLGMISLSLLLNGIGSLTNPMFALTPAWHFVLGGFAFGMVFMATDPVTAATTNQGRWIYGFLIGALVVLVRVVNPAFPEGMMLAILFGNCFAPLIDYMVVQRNIKRRLAHHGYP